MSIQVVVNGDPANVPDGSSVADVVARCVPGGAAGGRGTAVALSDVIVPAGRWATTSVAGGDRLEVVTAVAGG